MKMKNKTTNVKIYILKPTFLVFIDEVTSWLLTYSSFIFQNKRLLCCYSAHIYF